MLSSGYLKNSHQRFRKFLMLMVIAGGFVLVAVGWLEVGITLIDHKNINREPLVIESSNSMARLPTILG